MDQMTLLLLPFLLPIHHQSNCGAKTYENHGIASTAIFFHSQLTFEWLHSFLKMSHFLPSCHLLFFNYLASLIHHLIILQIEMFLSQWALHIESHRSLWTPYWMKTRCGLFIELALEGPNLLASWMAIHSFAKSLKGSSDGTLDLVALKGFS